MRAPFPFGRVLRGSPLRLVVAWHGSGDSLQVGDEGVGADPGDEDRANRGRHEAKGGAQRRSRESPKSGGSSRPVGVAGVVGHRGPRVSRRGAGLPSDAGAGPARVSSRTRHPEPRSPPRSHRSPLGILRSRYAFDSEGKLQIDRVLGTRTGTVHWRRSRWIAPLTIPMVPIRGLRLSAQRCAVDPQLDQDLFVARLDGQHPDAFSKLDRHGLRITRQKTRRCHAVRDCVEKHRSQG